MKYLKMESKPTLKERLETKVYIGAVEFAQRLEKEYSYYTYEKRARIILFIARDIKKTNYTWLGMELEKGE